MELFEDNAIDAYRIRFNGYEDNSNDNPNDNLNTTYRIMGKAIYFFSLENAQYKLENYFKMISSNNYDCIFFGKRWTSSISNLPPNIKTIIFDKNSIFNSRIENFPFNLKKIKFGIGFYQPLYNLPSSLEELEIASNYMHPLDDLPSSLKKLTLGDGFNIPLNNLPHNLEFLSIQSSSYVVELQNLPSKLKQLHLCMNWNCKPYKLIENFPPNLEEITFAYNYPHEITNLPDSVKIIRICRLNPHIDKLTKLYPNKKIFIY